MESEAYATLEPITQRVMLPLLPADLDEYAALMGRAEDVESDIAKYEKLLKMARIRKCELDLKIQSVLARRPKC